MPWGPKSLKVKRQTFSQDGSTQLKQPTPASLPVTGLEPRVQLGIEGRSKNFLVDVGANYSVLTPTMEPSLPKPVPFCVLQEKQLQKDSP